MKKPGNEKRVEGDDDTEMDSAAGNAFVAGLAFAWMTGIMGFVFLCGLMILIIWPWKIGTVVMVASFICWIAIRRWLARSVPDGY